MTGDAGNRMIGHQKQQSRQRHAHPPEGEAAQAEAEAEQEEVEKPNVDSIDPYVVERRIGQAAYPAESPVLEADQRIGNKTTAAYRISDDSGTTHKLLSRKCVEKREK